VKPDRAYLQAQIRCSQFKRSKRIGRRGAEGHPASFAGMDEREMLSVEAEAAERVG
jgi:hypothetical protein